MALKQEHALLVGVATAGVVFGLHQIAMPPIASVRASKPDNPHVEASRKSFTITAGSLVVLMGLLARDPTVFVIGGLSVIALDINMRVANAVDEGSSKLPTSSATGSASPSSPTAAITVQGA